MRAPAMLLAVLLALACAHIGLLQAEPLPQAAELALKPEERGQAQLPKLFDFEHYKQLFGKSYGSLLEELNRRRLVVARAFSAYVSGMKFKFNQQDHYESLNHMSDQSPAELEQMRNKLLARASRERAANGEEAADDAIFEERPATELPAFLPAEDENVDAELEKLIEEHGNEPAYQELRLAFEKRQLEQRSKRSIDEDSEEVETRELPQLINVGALESQLASSDANQKVVAHPESNNPNYEHIELPSFGLTDQQEDLRWWKIGKGLVSRETVSDQLYNSLIGLEPPKLQKLKKTSGKGGKVTDSKMYFDHRDSKCLLTPRSQGNCGCCYAFAAVSIMEWLHCKKTGELVAFSEQYFVDCGKGRFQDQMDGCEGATDPAVGRFVHNFGMELRANYPYKARESQCPYDEDYDLKKTGYIRMELGDAVRIPQAKWEQYISFQPLLIGIRAPGSFSWYGGGVYDGSKCTEEADHAMVLVGHGRQNGVDYWLIRNSYGPGWGEGGYYKLAKAATKKCLDPSGMAFGTPDARSHTLQIKQAPGSNERRPVQEDGYIRSLLNWAG